MKVTYHIISSVPLGAGYYFMSNDLPCSLLAMCSAIVVDADHCLDYVITQKRVDSIKKMSEAFETFKLIHKNYFFFHSWELLLIFGICAFLGNSLYGIAFFTGYAFHMLSDQIFNTLFLGRYNVKFFFYFLLYRLHFNFDVLPLRKQGKQINTDEVIY